MDPHTMSTPHLLNAIRNNTKPEVSLNDGSNCCSYRRGS